MKKVIDFLKSNHLHCIIVSLIVVIALLFVALICCIIKYETAPAGIVGDDGDFETEKHNGLSPIETVNLTNDQADRPFDKRSHGIDVSKWQGKIDWAKVKSCGINFAYIRVGLRGEDGKLYEDECAEYNLKEAQKNDILIGAYYFSTANSVKEAEEEADWVIDYIKSYSISYPVVYDCEGYQNPQSRMFALSAEERTDVAMAFLAKVRKAGYDTMFYGAKNDLQTDFWWNVDRIEKEHKIWIALYSKVVYPYKDDPGYIGRLDAWQYSPDGKIDGIDTNVDLVVCYFTVDKAKPKVDDGNTDVTDAPSTDATITVHGVVFRKEADSVTAKNKVNLRFIPSTEAEYVVGELNRGEFVDRIGISDNGWSMLMYKGATVYAVSGYLTTELTDETDDGPDKMEFDVRDDIVTAKSETNLRTAPSTTLSEVVYTLKNGEYIKRIGINEALGWSKLDYNGQIVYAVSSYLTVKID